MSQRRKASSSSDRCRRGLDAVEEVRRFVETPDGEPRIDAQGADHPRSGGIVDILDQDDVVAVQRDRDPFLGLEPGADDAARARRPSFGEPARPFDRLSKAGQRTEGLPGESS